MASVQVEQDASGLGLAQAAIYLSCLQLYCYCHVLRSLAIVNVDPIWAAGHKKAGYEINASASRLPLALSCPCWQLEEQPKRSSLIGNLCFCGRVGYACSFSVKRKPRASCLSLYFFLFSLLFFLLYIPALHLFHVALLSQQLVLTDVPYSYPSEALALLSAQDQLSLALAAHYILLLLKYFAFCSLLLAAAGVGQSFNYFIIPLFRACKLRFLLLFQLRQDHRHHCRFFSGPFLPDRHKKQFFSQGMLWVSCWPQWPQVATFCETAIIKPAG